MTHAILLALAPIFFVLLLNYGAGRRRIERGIQHRNDGDRHRYAVSPMKS